MLKSILVGVSALCLFAATSAEAVMGMDPSSALSYSNVVKGKTTNSTKTRGTSGRSGNVAPKAEQTGDRGNHVYLVSRSSALLPSGKVKNSDVVYIHLPKGWKNTKTNSLGPNNYVSPNNTMSAINEAGEAVTALMNGYVTSCGSRTAPTNQDNGEALGKLTYSAPSGNLEGLGCKLTFYSSDGSQSKTLQIGSVATPMSKNDACALYPLAMLCNQQQYQYDPSRGPVGAMAGGHEEGYSNFSNDLPSFDQGSSSSQNGELEAALTHFNVLDAREGTVGVRQIGTFAVDNNGDLFMP